MNRAPDGDRGSTLCGVFRWLTEPDKALINGRDYDSDLITGYLVSTHIAADDLCSRLALSL
jgi:hypothetical protein